MTGSLLPLRTDLACITGNTAKVKVLGELRKLLDRGAPLKILDVGCVGPKPFEFWEPLLEDPGLSFHLTGVDVAGIHRAQKVIAERGWSDRVTLRQASGYGLSGIFEPAAFDVIVATQVLEHVARLDAFLAQVAAVLAPGGECFFTTDSGHWEARFALRDPVRLVKNLVKKGLALAGYERHYDLPWLDHEIADACARSGLEVADVGYYNLAPLKHIHNHVLRAGQKNSLMEQWFDLEEALNQEEEVRRNAKSFFLVLYVHAWRRPPACKPAFMPTSK